MSFIFNINPLFLEDCSSINLLIKVSIFYLDVEQGIKSYSLCFNKASKAAFRFQFLLLYFYF